MIFRNIKSGVSREHIKGSGDLLISLTKGPSVVRQAQRDLGKVGLQALGPGFSAGQVHS